MGRKRKMHGGVLGFIGFMLSPLSWWNDLFINVPLAVAFAWPIALIHKPAFEPAVIVGYWLTNVLGFFLLHKGAAKMLDQESPATLPRHHLLRDVGISILYTLLIVILVKLKLVQPIPDYFSGR